MKNTGKASKKTNFIETPKFEKYFDGSGLETSPVLDERRLYLYHANGIVAINRKSGDVVWSKRLEEVPTTSPLVACGAVICQSLNKVSALDVENGSELWQNEFGTGATHPNLTASENGLFIASSSRIVYIGFDGTVNWKLNLNKPIHGTAFDGNQLVVTTGASNIESTVFSIDVSSEEVVWKQNGIYSITPPSLTKEYAYITSRTGGLYCIGLDSGAVQWSSELSGDSTYTTAAVNESAGQLYCSTGSTGDLLALDTETGEEVWRTFVESYASNPVVHDQNQILYPGDDIRSINPDDGSVNWVSEEYTATGPAALSTTGMWVSTSEGLFKMTSSIA